MQKACLVLSDGSVFEGFRFGANRDAICEVVFTTGLTGYVELLTDPSFCGQAVTMASPIIGNYGVFESVSESTRPWVGAYVVRDITEIIGDERNAEDLDVYLKRNDIPGISGVDTRALTLLLREHGTMIGLLTDGTKDTIDRAAAEKRIASYDNRLFVPTVSRKTSRVFPAWTKGWQKDLFLKDAAEGKPTRLVENMPEQANQPAKYKIALLDYGVKHNIIWNLVDRGCEVTAFPWDTQAEEILAMKPDGIFLSNGPGDPKNCGKAIEEMRKLYDFGIPIMGICLGHQLMALATGADTHKLRYGHRGINHPVKDLRADRVYITSQNHGYVVNDESVNLAICEVSHVNMNDGTIEGLRYTKKPVFTVQYHPEAAPGPRDNNYLFEEFIAMIDAQKNG